MFRIVLVDFLYTYFRSYYVFPELQNIHEGTRYLTGAMYGVLSTVNWARRKYNCPVIVMTEPESNARRFQINKDYKAGREKKDPEIFRLLKETQRALALFKDVFVMSSDDDGEADDLIFTFIRHNAQRFDQFIVVSSDNDLLQIAGVPELSGKVFYAPQSRKDPNETPFEKYCSEKYGVTPEKILLFRAIFGDQSDNLAPAGQRILKKFVLPYIEKSTDLESLKKTLIENQSEKYAGKVLEGWQNVEKNYKIMQLSSLRMKNITNPEGRDAFYFIQKYGMNSLAEFTQQ